ncbi:MAG: DUF6457 domain-containing protein [Propionibacteriales bacterium]|nr:DUF6457 domain-containing protein [Propionibacteriales bacterium]
MNLHDWIDELCDALDVEIDLDEALVLDVAKDAAENVDRSAAPITAFLLGYAAARSQGAPDQVEELAAAASDLALRWDKSPDALEEEDEPEVDEEIELDDELESV